jgi:hypothetical protein
MIGSVPILDSFLESIEMFIHPNNTAITFSFRMFADVLIVDEYHHLSILDS